MIIWSIAKTTIGDVMRKKILQIFLVVAIGLIVISLSFSQTLEFSTRQGSSTDLMLMKSFGLGLMAIAGLFISLFIGVSLIPQEIERRTIYTILAKPVNRYEFIIGKFLGAIITLGINIGLMGLVFVAVVTFKAMGAEALVVSADAAGSVAEAGARSVGLFDANLIWGVVLIYLQFVVLTGVVILFSTFFTPTVNFFMGAGVYMLGSITPMIKTLADRSTDSMNPVVKGIYSLLSSGYIIPDFDKFNVTNALLHPEAHITNLGFYTFQIGLVGVLYALVMMTLAVIVFWKKEV